MSELPLDRAGRRRSPATLPGFHAGHAPGNKGLRYPADPRGRHGRLGLGQPQPWLDMRASFRSVRCCASSTAQHGDVTGRPPRHAELGAPRPRQECGAGSRHTTPMPSRWRAKACR